MRLDANIGGQPSAVSIRIEDSRVFAEIDGRKHEVEVHRTGTGYLILSDGQVFECRVEGVPRSGKDVDVFVGPSHHVVTLTDPKRLRGAATAGAHADGAARILAPMPGKVVRVLAQQGSEVAAGAGVLVVEAMKMQNELKSPKAGTIVTMNVEVGATVNGGDVLAVIE